jgi:hypothetical protein
VQGITFWVIWIERNGKAFNNENWHVHKRQKFIWDVLVDCGSATWAKCVKLFKHVLIKEMKYLKKFDKSWGKHKVICDKRGRFIKWCYDGPQKGFVS